MCNAYGLSSKTYAYRLAHGYSKEKALTTPLICEKRKTLDHLGNLYESQNDMLRHYGISKSLFESRIRRGYSLEESLTCDCQNDNTNKMLKLNNGKICDFNDKEFKSFKKMCEYYHVNYSVFKSRFKRGMTLKESLNPNPRIATNAYDHLGNKFDNIKEMCKKYEISVKLFNKRFYEYKWTIEEALTIPQNMYIGEYRVTECLKRLNINFDHDRTIKTIFNNFELNIDWNEFINTLQNNFSLAGYNWDSKKIQQLRPDFVIYTDKKNKICGVIEFDGEQHQNFVEYFFKTVEEFYKRCDIDFAKQSLWEYLNIPMLRIRHDQIDMIDEMIMDFVDNPQYYIHNHNTYLSETEYWSILQKQKEQINLSSTKTENEYLEEDIDDDLER